MRSGRTGMCRAHQMLRQESCCSAKQQGAVINKLLLLDCNLPGENQSIGQHPFLQDLHEEPLRSQ